MKVVKQAKEESYEDFYIDQYEFRLCGGSVEPKDAEAKSKESKSEEEGK